MQFEKIMNNGRVYNFLQKAIRTKKAYESLNNYFSQPSLADNSKTIKVLDIGCGPGTYVPYLLDSDYLGIDINKGNISLAEKKYSNFPNIKFVAEDVYEYFSKHMMLENTFDIVFMSNVLHHLSKDIIISILPIIPKLIKKDGEFRSCDPIYTKEQSKISKWLMSHDRGKYILGLDDYLCLIKSYFPIVEHKIETDSFRFPFPYPGIQCRGYLHGKDKIGAALT